MSGPGLSRVLSEAFAFLLKRPNNRLAHILKLALKVAPLIVLLRLLHWAGRLTEGRPSTLTHRPRRTSACTELELIPEEEPEHEELQLT